MTLVGADSQLWVEPVGPTRVDALAGSNVTLAVTFSDVTQPAITWFMGAFPVATYNINSTTQPDVAQNASAVVKVDPRGYLTFHRVPLLYTSTYTLEVTKSGFGEASVTFTLNVFGAYQVILDFTCTEINFIAFMAFNKCVYALQMLFCQICYLKEAVTWHYGAKEKPVYSSFTTCDASKKLLLDWCP